MIRNIASSILLLLIMLLFAGAPSTAKDKLTIITEDYPPLNHYEGDVLKGPSVEIVREIMRRLKLDGKIKVYPWARGYKFVQERPNTILFSMTRTKKRDPLFKWVGPLAEKRIGLYARKDSTIKLKKMADAKEYLIGVQRDGVGMQLLEAAGHQKFDSTTTGATNLKKLLHKRTDLWFSSNATVFANCQKLKLKSCDVKLVTFMYIAFSKSTPDAIVTRWQQTYDTLVKEGVPQDIFKKYGMANLIPAKY